MAGFNNLWGFRLLSSMRFLNHLPREFRVALHRDYAIEGLLERFRDGRPPHPPTHDEIVRFRAGDLAECERLDLIERALLTLDYEECAKVLSRLGIDP